MIRVLGVLKNWLKHASWRTRISAVGVAALLAVVVIKAVSGEPEIALVIGEPYEDMRKRSSASIGPAMAGRSSFNIPKSDARLRFIDAQYGFVTPQARFFAVMFDEGVVDSVRMSPQVEPLLLDDTLKLILDLQDQWRQKDWRAIRPPIADTPYWRGRLQNERKGGTTRWQAANLYQVMLNVGRFDDPKRPNEERYLITLSLAEPWVKP